MKKFPSLKIFSLFLFYVCSLTQLYAFDLFQANVHSIYDGDTLKVIFAGEDQVKTIRLKGVDTPEIDHRGETQGEIALMARDFLRELLPTGSKIDLKILKGEQRARRLYAQVFSRGLDVNKELLRQGLAVTYILAPFEEQTLAEYVLALEEAIENELGIYNEHFRKEQEAAALLEPYLWRLQVQGKTGHYLIGDFQTKKLFHGNEIQKVAVNRRVFFHNEALATSSGYSFERNATPLY